MAGQRTGRSRFGFKMVLLAVLCCALHVKDLKAYRTLAVPGSGAPENRRVLPPLTTPANPEEHVFIPLEDYGRKIEDLFQGQEFLFIRGGVGVGKTTLRFHLAREYPERFVSVRFEDGEEESWIQNIIEAIEDASQTKLRGRKRLADALHLAVDRDLILVLDEAHTIFQSQRLCTLLFKSDVHPNLLLLSASGETNATMSWTTPSEIKQKIFWTPPVPEDFGDLTNLTNQLKEADVQLDQRSVEFFMKLCGGHRSIFIAAMTWVREEQLGEPWDDFGTVVSKVQDSSATRDWSKGTFLGALAESRGVKVNGKYGDLNMVPDEFIRLLCEGPDQIPGDLRRELTIHGFVIPVPESPEKEFRKLDWTRSKTKYAVSNPILASYYRDELESVRGLKVGVDPSAFQPANCLDLLLRAIPYLTYEYVVGRPFDAADSRAILSKDNLPFEDLYNAAIINTLRRLGYGAGSSESPSLGKVDVFINLEQQFRMEGIMANRTQGEHDEHRDRFDKPNQTAYSKADHKGLFTIGNKERVRKRVRVTRAEGVEIIGLVPNIAHTGYCILYRGAQAAPADLVEYYVECDLVARGLIDGQIRCIQKFLHINPSPNRPGATETQAKAVWVRQLRQDDSGGFEFAGDAFKITGAAADIDDLKKAIEKEEKLAIAPSKIEIFSRQEDGNWSKEDEETSIERGVSKLDCYGYLIP